MEFSYSIYFQANPMDFHLLVWTALDTKWEIQLGKSSIVVVVEIVAATWVLWPLGVTKTCFLKQEFSL